MVKSLLHFTWDVCLSRFYGVHAEGSTSRLDIVIHSGRSVVFTQHNNSSRCGRTTCGLYVYCERFSSIPGSGARPRWPKSTLLHLLYPRFLQPCRLLPWWFRNFIIFKREIWAFLQLLKAAGVDYSKHDRPKVPHPDGRTFGIKASPSTIARRSAPLKSSSIW